MPRSVSKLGHRRSAVLFPIELNELRTHTVYSHGGIKGHSAKTNREPGYECEIASALLRLGSDRICGRAARTIQFFGVPAFERFSTPTKFAHTKTGSSR